MKKTTDRKRVNFSNFSDKNRTLLHDFRTAIIAIAEENAKYSTASKPIKTQREKTLALRESAIQDGMDYNDETLVLIIEDIFHEVVFQESAHPESSHQQADITRCHCKYVQRGIAQIRYR